VGGWGGGGGMERDFNGDGMQDGKDEGVFMRT
jgi:hypothetical protein